NKRHCRACGPLRYGSGNFACPSHLTRRVHSFRESSESFPRHLGIFRATLHSTSSGIDIGNQFVVESAMTIPQTTGRYIFFVSVFMLMLQVAVVTGQNRKGGVTVSYESLGSSRVARFTNSNSFPVRLEFSYNGTRLRGSGEASGEDAVFVGANHSA